MFAKLTNKRTKKTNLSKCVGKKTDLLQTSVVGWLVRFANVLFCALAVHKFIFFLSLSSKLSTVLLSFTLGGNV
jgi:hypothetical protein